MRKQACVPSLSSSDEEVYYVRDKLLAIIGNCNGNLESHDENQTLEWENIVSSPKTIEIEIHARIMRENMLRLCSV